MKKNAEKMVLKVDWKARLRELALKSRELEQLGQRIAKMK